MKKIIVIIVLILQGYSSTAFCGFYVAKADAKLFNKTSQVILVRNGNESVITMSSDFTGELTDFAMVVPVPVILQRNDIAVVDRVIFEKMDAYSGPRLVEYHDNHPCLQDILFDKVPSAAEMSSAGAQKQARESNTTTSQVKIEAKYTVGEYDILILSAKESGSLETWLNSNGYKIPKGAKDVLEPYIKYNMKFFVVKVNLEEMDKTGSALLRPLQIRFQTEKFMLPIRLGMANANGEQDMIIYTLTRNGRVETSNYRTVKIPTDKNVPEFVEDIFGRFYVDLYEKTRKREGGNNLFLEYGWNISGNAGVKCDPCPSPPPIMQDLVNAGVNWLQANGWNGYSGNVYFTRLHVTYSREHFPQDLVFHETGNTENFQGRYIITHPAQGPFDCEEGKNYQAMVRQRRAKELQQLASLTGWDVSGYNGYIYKLNNYELPSNPIRHKQFQPKKKYSDTVGVNINPKPIPNEDSRNFEPVYQAQSITDNKQIITPAFIMLSLIMLAGVVNIRRLNK